MARASTTPCPDGLRCARAFWRWAAVRVSAAGGRVAAPVMAKRLSVSWRVCAHVRACLAPVCICVRSAHGTVLVPQATPAPARQWARTTSKQSPAGKTTTSARTRTHHASHAARFTTPTPPLFVWSLTVHWPCADGVLAVYRPRAGRACADREPTVSVSVTDRVLTTRSSAQVRPRVHVELALDHSHRLRDNRPDGESGARLPVRCTSQSCPRLAACLCPR